VQNLVVGDQPVLFIDVHIPAMIGHLNENGVLALLENIPNEPASIHKLACKTGIDHRTIRKYIYLMMQIQNSPRIKLETIGMRVFVRKERESGNSHAKMPSINQHAPEQSTASRGGREGITAQSSIERRLGTLEKRVAVLETQKTTPNKAKGDNVMRLVGFAFLARHMYEKIMSSQQSGEYDSYMEGIFKVEITKENRLEYADKLRKLSLALLDDAEAEFKKRKA